MEIISDTCFQRLGFVEKGKVRDNYDLDPYLLIVATDRISAFDMIVGAIPGKGAVLNQLSVRWFKKLYHIVPNHFITDKIARYPEVCQLFYAEALKGRSMLVKKAKPLPVECVVRGYISGSAWSDYKKGKPTCGITLPLGLVESQKLPEPIFTPTTKAESGHDLPITFDKVAGLIGLPLAILIRDASLRLYLEGSKIAEQAGIIIADTKFEFGLDENGELILIDELLTPDSSRFWPKNDYEPGRPQKSFDKQYLRDYLVSIGWDQKPPPPPLPEEIINQTSAKYIEAHKRLAKVLAG